MIRIEETKQDVIHVRRGSEDSYETDPASLGSEVLLKYQTLRCTDAPTRIEGIGARINEHTYWIFEDDDDAEEHRFDTSHLVTADYMMYRNPSSQI